MALKFTGGKARQSPMNQTQFDNMDILRQRLSRADTALREAIEAAKKAGPNAQAFTGQLDTMQAAVRNMALKAEDFLHNN